MKVVFVCPDAIALFDPSSPRPHGGAEVRAVTFAIALAREPGVEVTVIVGADEPARQRVDRGVTLVYEPRLGAVDAPLFLRPMIGALLRDASASPSFPWIKIRRWSLPLLWRVPIVAAVKVSNSVRNVLRPAIRVRDEFAGIEADCVCVFGVRQTSADAVASLKASGVRSVYFAAADYDFSDVYSEGSERQNMYGVPGKIGHYAIKNADLVVVQTDTQMELLRKKFGREGVRIRNPIELDDADPPRPADLPPRYVLWVGRSDQTPKRPSAALEAARRLPDVSFVMVMNRYDPAVFDDAVRNCPPNVRIIEHVPFGEIDAYYRHARLFLNTSVFEGFPNAFLQAGKHGVPIVSLDVDPDGMLEQHCCGLFAQGDADRLARSIELLWNDDAQWATHSEAVGRYVRDCHEAGARARELKAFLQHALDAKTRNDTAKKGGAA